jgi:mannose-6-phosphate isomerase-like protein (cupin superfamily)
MDIIQRSETRPFRTKDGSTIRELLAHRNSCIRNQSLAEATVPPGVTTQAHYHPQSEEIYYILSGTGTMTLGGVSRGVKAGDAIAIPPGEIHWIANTTDADLIFLCCCAPGYEHLDTVLVEDHFSPPQSNLATD